MYGHDSTKQGNVGGEKVPQSIVVGESSGPYSLMFKSFHLLLSDSTLLHTLDGLGLPVNVCNFTN